MLTLPKDAAHASATELARLNLLLQPYIARDPRAFHVAPTNLWTFYVTACCQNPITLATGTSVGNKKGCQFHWDTQTLVCARLKKVALTPATAAVEVDPQPPPQAEPLDDNDPTALGKLERQGGALFNCASGLPLQSACLRGTRFVFGTTQRSTCRECGDVQEERDGGGSSGSSGTGSSSGITLTCRRECGSTHLDRDTPIIRSICKGCGHIHEEWEGGWSWRGYMCRRCTEGDPLGIVAPRLVLCF